MALTPWLIVLLVGCVTPPGRQGDAGPAKAAQNPAPQVFARVPLQIRDARVSLEVMVNGQGPFRFGLDTGSSPAAHVTRALVERLGLPVVDGFRVSDGSGINSRNADGVRIDALQLGDASFTEILAPVLGAGPGEGGVPEVHGTIGLALFAGHLVTLDYPGREIRIMTGRLPKADGLTILDYALDRGTPRIEIRIGGLVFDVWMDSGAGGAILLPLSYADRLPLRTPLRQAGTIASVVNEFDLFRSELDGEARIGQATFRDPALLFSELIQGPTLGPGILHRFALTFDERNRRVRLEDAPAR